MPGSPMKGTHMGALSARAMSGRGSDPGSSDECVAGVDAAPTLRGRELGRQLVAAPLAEPLVLLGVDPAGVFENLGRTCS